MTRLDYFNFRKYFEYCPDTGEFHRLFIRDRWGNETPVIKKVGTVRKDGYLEINVFGSSYKAHRLAWFYMTGMWPNELDHINGNRKDNSWCNLREASKNVNMKNRGLNYNNTSGTSGVTWFEQTQQWRARINLNGRRISLGLFDTIEQASQARSEAEIHLGYHPNHGARPSWRG